MAAAAHRSEQRSARSGQAAVRAENRRLRTLVDRYRGCLSSLDAQSQRLLSLRAGLHGAPQSATAVARTLHITPARERLLEQMSLVALRSSARATCAGQSTAAAVPVVSEMTATAPWVTPAPASTQSSAATGSGRSPVSASGSSHHSTTKPIVITQAANTRTAENDATASDPLSAIEIALFAIVVLAAALLLMPGVRRRLLPVLAGVPAADGFAGRTGPRASGATASVAAPVSVMGPPSPADGEGMSTAGAGTIVAGDAAAVASRSTRNGSPNGAASRWDAFATRPPATPSASPETAGKPADESPAADKPAEELPAAVKPRAEVKPAPAQPRPVVEPEHLTSRASGSGSRPGTHWLREHATQGALVATVVAGGLARILRRGRR